MKVGKNQNDNLKTKKNFGMTTNSCQNILVYPSFFLENLISQKQRRIQKTKALNIHNSEPLEGLQRINKDAFMFLLENQGQASI